MYAIGYLIVFIMGVMVMDHFEQKAADEDLEAELSNQIRAAFGHIQGPIDLALAEHEAQVEAINGLMVDDDPDLNDPYRGD